MYKTRQPRVTVLYYCTVRVNKLLQVTMEL